jgi:hypothetical protein
MIKHKEAVKISHSTLLFNLDFILLSNFIKYIENTAVAVPVSKFYTTDY